MKYIFCILLGIFLSWGFQLISDERQEAYRPETGSTYIQTCVNAFHPETKTMIKQLGKEKKLVKAKENTGKRHYKIFCVNGKYGIQNRVPYFLFYTFTK